MCSLDSTAILGAATGYSPDKVELFLESLNTTDFQGKVVLFINSMQFNDYNNFYCKKKYQFELEFELSKIGIIPFL